MAAEAPKATKSQPTGLYCLREPTKAPTVAKGTAVERTRGTRATSLTGHSRNPRQIPATIRAQKVQANPAARRPDSPTPRPCSLAPSVTTPLYSTPVSYALRGGVFSGPRGPRGPRGGEVRRALHLWRSGSWSCGSRHGGPRTGQKAQCSWGDERERKGEEHRVF
jgi:hypothetical protein